MDDAAILEAVLDSLNDGVYAVDRNRRIIHWNGAAARLTGYGRDEAVGRLCGEGLLAHQDAGGRVLCSEGCPMAGAMEDGQARTVELYFRHKSGYRVQATGRVAPIRDSAGRVCGAVLVFSDDLRLVNAATQVHELEKLTLVDQLTGLPNRRHLEIILTARLEEGRRHGWATGVLLADIDHFKQINDRHGHAIGDEALRMVGITLASDARPYDLIGRWGGEEFLGIFPRVTADELSAIAERKRALVEEASLSTGEGPLRLTVSIGIALARPGETADSLIRAVDERLYESKTRGRNCVTARAPAA